ncbi:unnamed protein product [Linum trigynum]|uniref:Reverse transcriptase domain-containing protein n=1 Tax=Linum trigynum TaxID=586398 RepID=A0AAV2ETP4_9ROSI
MKALERVPRSDAILQQRKKLEQELEELEDQEELYWKQRSRADWLRDGDKNSGFFHKKASARRKRNTIRRIQEELGGFVTKHDDIAACLVKYFDKLFEAGPVPHETPILDTVTASISAEQNEALLLPFNRDEIFFALKQMGQRKAPGEDGFSVLFFRRNWSVVGDDVVKMVTQILEQGEMLAGLNHTLLALIPKVKNPVTPKEYRPISLCNVVYKLVSKVLANRLKPLLNQVISEEQSAFVPGRVIIDNIMAAFECFHTMKRKKKSRIAYCAAKIDMAKAYDRVEWHFLESMMNRLGFAERWVKLIMMCVTTVTYSVLINGHQSERFTPTRGIRQGDPLSPYLFLICAEGLSAATKNAGRERRLRGIEPARGAPAVTHLFFADDSVFFCRATEQETQELKNILLDYEKESGQLVNFQKSEISFSENVKTHQRLIVGGILGMQIVSKHNKYLGLPTVVGRSKKEIFQGLKERVRSKLKGWKEKTLSIAERETLIKAVAQAQLTYAMSVFKILESILDEIHSMITNFYWGQRGSERRIHWVRREELVCEKEDGGLGLRDLRGFNTAMLAKQVWRLYQRPDTLIARIMKAKYYKNSTVLDAKVGYNPSFIWRSLMSSQGLLLDGTRWRIGDGQNVRVWGDKWLPTEPYYVDDTPRGLAVDAMVCDLIDVETGGWDDTLLEASFTSEVARTIAAIPLRDQGEKDVLIWAGSEKGDYTVKEGYR